MKFNRRTDEESLPLFKRVDILRIIKNILALIVIMGICTALSMCFGTIGIIESAAVMVYILGIFLFSYLASGYFYSLLAAVVGVMLYNFFFTEPFYTFDVNRPVYLVTFAVMFIVGSFTSMMTIKIKRETMLAEEREERINSLYQIERKLLGVSRIENLAKVSASEIMSHLSANTLIVFIDDSGKESCRYATCGGVFDEEKELLACREAFQSGNPCGRGTHLFPSLKTYYYPILGQEGPVGVIGALTGDGRIIDKDQIQFLGMAAPQIAVVLERERLYEKQHNTEIQVQSERMRADMLRTISHDLRTPLTGIMGSASTAFDNYDDISEDVKKAFFRSIYNDASSLNAMVENILSITRFDEGKIRLNLSEEAAEEITAEAVGGVRKRAIKHKIIVDMPEDIVIIKVDGVLIKQVIVNLLENAVNYTPEGSEITVSFRKVKDGVLFEVSDNGPGISDEDLPHVFERFYTRHEKAYSQKRGTGLGLAICKIIIDLHGGKITAENVIPHGAKISFLIPSKEENYDAALNTDRG
jgi:Osmosensitive K+ channel histidine kinase